MSTVEQRLQQLGIVLPDPMTPLANYVPYVIARNMVYISGQVPLRDGQFQYVGKVGRDLDVEQAVAAARLCAVNILSQLRTACGGDLERVVRCVKLGGFVNATPEFQDHPTVVNGASDLMVEVFGDQGRHARFAVGAGSLPRGVAVEVDAVFEIA